MSVRITWPALADLRVWGETSVRSREAIAVEIAAAIGDGFRAGEESLGEAGLICLFHPLFPTLRLAVIPGGRFEMGLLEADLEELSQYIDWTKRVRLISDGMRARASPPHQVEVKPFVVSERPLTRAELELIEPGVRSTDLERKQAIVLSGQIGVRLPSEAELEWLARDGGRCSFVVDGGRAWSQNDAWPDCGSFGIRCLNEGEWAADDWHASYEGAPTTSEAWMNGDPCGVFRGELAYGTDQDPSELCLGLAAHRNRGASKEDWHSDHAFFPLRLAFDLP